MCWRFGSSRISVRHAETWPDVQTRPDNFLNDTVEIRGVLWDTRVGGSHAKIR